MADAEGQGAAQQQQGSQQQQQDWLKLSSFDATSFFAEEERRRALQGEQLRAAAEALLPSSSEEESGSSEAEEEGERRGAGQRQQPGEGRDDEASGERRRSRSKKDERKRRRGSRSRSRGRHEGKRRRREREGRRRGQLDEWQEAVEAERKRGPNARASQVRGWTTGGLEAQKETYCYDTRGDPANLAFGRLYRVDIAAYRRHDPARFATSLGAPLRRMPPWFRDPLPTEADGHRQQARLRQQGRYFSAPVARRERSARLRRWRRPPPPLGDAAPGRERQQRERGLAGGGPVSVAGPAFLPLDPARDADLPPQREEQPASFYQVFVPLAQRQQQQAEQQLERGAGAPAAQLPPAQRLEAESREEALLRRTREFNAATRERPQDLQLWLDFASFQDEVARSGPARRGAQRAAAEKKVAILERALGFHPGSDRLLLALLQAAQPLCDEEEMGRRWRSALARHPGSPALWRAYLRRRAAQWAGFSAGDLPALHCQAVAALARARRRAAVEGAAPAAVAALECELAHLALGGCRAALAAGATELGVGMLQVLLEFNFFAPEGWPQEALEVMFEDFWASDAALVGEEGGAGWAAWLAGEPQQRPAAAAARQKRQAAAAKEAAAAEAAAAAQGQRGGGWVEAAEGGGGTAAKPAAASGWEELAPAIEARFGHSLKFLEEEPPAPAQQAEEQQQGEQQEPAGLDHQAEEGDAAAGGAEGEAPGGREKDEEEEEEEEGQHEEEEEEEAEEEEEQEESEEALLQRLGLQLDEALEAAGQELPPPVLDAWLSTEQQREAAAAAPQRAGPGGGGSGSEDEEDAGEEEEASGARQQRRKVAWREVRPLLVTLESEAARQQLLLGALLLLGAPLPLPASPRAGDATAWDELWLAATWLGAPEAAVASSSGGDCGGSTPLLWAAQLLASGNWGWLGCHDSSGSVQSEQQQEEELKDQRDGVGCALRQRRWYLESPARHRFLLSLLTALARGPCRHQPAAATALLRVASEVPATAAATDAAPGPARAAAQPPQRDWAAARGLAKQLLAGQRHDLALWQAYAELERQAGSRKAACKVFDACLAGAAASPASAFTAPLVLSGVALELGGSGRSGSSGRSVSSGFSLLGAASAAPEAAAGRALRLLAWLGSGGAVALKPPAGAAATLDVSEVVAARRGYQDTLLALLQQHQQQGGPGPAAGRRGAAIGSPQAAQVAAAACFEMLAGRLLRGSLSAGVKAALAIYDQLLTALLEQQQQQQQQQQHGGAEGQAARPSGIASTGAGATCVEQLCVQWCSLGADAARAGLPASSPAAARAALSRCLAAFPASTPLLQLLVAHEVVGHTTHQLRRALLALLSDQPSPPAWLALLAAEVLTRAPASAARAVLERAVGSEGGRACPLLWRLYLRWEAAAGRADAVHRVFLRAIGACPGAKAVWTDGLALLNGAAPARELTEFLEVMRDKGLTLRTDAFEVLLERMGAPAPA